MRKAELAGNSQISGIAWKNSILVSLGHMVAMFFSIASTGGSKPWYVGMTAAGFKNECFQAPKQNYYHKALLARQGVPYLHLIALVTPTQRFVRSPGNQVSAIEFLEKTLIARALDKNPELMNVRDTKFLKELVVEGFIKGGPGSPDRATLELKKILA